MTNNTPSGAKIVKVLNQIFVFPSSSSDGLAQICVTLSQWFSHKNSIFHWAVHQPIALLEVWSLMRTAHCMASFATPFFLHVYMHVHKSLSNEIITEDCWIRNTVCVQGDVRECLKRAWSGQWFSSQYCIHLLRKSVRTDLLLCDRWQT